MASDRFVFAHLADAHVGAWPRDLAVRSALRESLLRALAVAESRDAAFLLISGDLFHTPVPDPGEVAPVAAALRRFVDQGRRIYVIYGSHDYVAQRTSWLDVLAETGVFLKVAPEAVRTEGKRWTLPFHLDEPTGARIAGISGRSHGLDREYFRAVDSECFRSEPGFKVFQFHAAVEEYLPESLREHIHGIHVEDLPAGCDYYAGGHIHYTYVGEGPGGGLLVNPGAVFGTSRTDLENGQAGKTHQGVVVVTVDHGRPTAEFIDTAPRDAVRLVDVDVSGKTAEEAKAELEQRLSSESAPGALLFPRVHGTLSDGSLASLALTQVARKRSPEAGTVHWDVRDLAPASAEGTAPTSESSVESEELRRLLAATAPGRPWLEGTDGEARVRELLRELGTPKSEGESRQDYTNTRVRSGRRILGVRAEDAEG
ncbi:MAG TPA: DNA repair exonuclease [Thermoplasmata archaeon]|nr:DNA repair exonuclease [Thermoplasmata archaeon]